MRVLKVNRYIVAFFFISVSVGCLPIASFTPEDGLCTSTLNLDFYPISIEELSDQEFSYKFQTSSLDDEYLVVPIGGWSFVQNADEITIDDTRILRVADENDVCILAIEAFYLNVVPSLARQAISNNVGRTSPLEIRDALTQTEAEIEMFDEEALFVEFGVLQDRRMIFVEFVIFNSLAVRL